jgi:hypothetical protein
MFSRMVSMDVIFIFLTCTRLVEELRRNDRADSRGLPTSENSSGPGKTNGALPEAVRRPVCRNELKSGRT